MAVKKTSDLRLTRKKRIRRKLRGSSDRPRFSVFRSARYVYAQLIDDDTANTLCAASSLEADLRKSLKSARSVEAAQAVGKRLAERAQDKKIKSVVFDRNGYIYRGRVKALADSARESGLSF